MTNETSERELCTLESLPGELLNRIYRYAVVDEKLVMAAARVDSTSKWKSNEPALARTCRQFRREILPIYYAENIFKFPISKRWLELAVSKDEICAWLKAIGAARWDIVRVGANFNIKNEREEMGMKFVRWEEVDVITTISHKKQQIETRFSKKFKGQCKCWLGRSTIWNYLGDKNDFERLAYAVECSYNIFAWLYSEADKCCFRCGEPFDEG